MNSTGYHKRIDMKQRDIYFNSNSEEILDDIPRKILSLPRKYIPWLQRELLRLHNENLERKRTNENHKQIQFKKEN
jgi:hypothetical protein